MNWQTKKVISVLLVALFVFTNTASAIQHYDTLMNVNAESYLDEGAQTIDYFVNQNSVDISGKIYDPDSEITNLTFNISNESSNISKEVDYLGETDQNGFKDFTVTYEITEDNTVYNSVYAIATNSVNETFEVSLFDEFENTINVNSIINFQK